MPRVPAHQVTTRNLGAAYPFIAEAGLGRRGVVIGDDLLGGSFVFDPFELYAAGVVSNPNMVVFGQIGRGKSAFVKSFLWRQAVFGRRAWVVDPKGEYGDLADAWGVRPVALRPGGAIRLNPLDPGPDGDDAGPLGPDPTGRRRMELLSSLASACLGRSLAPRERAALGAALAETTRGRGRPHRADGGRGPAVPERGGRPLPAHRAARPARGRPRRRVGAAPPRARRPVRHVRRADDARPRPLGAARRPRPVRAVLVCRARRPDGVRHGLVAGRAGPDRCRRRRVPRSDRARFFLVVDEAWAILSNLGVARWLQSSWKLSRAFGVSNVAVLHRVSDLRSVGASDSEQVALAQGLLADSETRVVYAQSPGELEAAAELLSLSATEAELLPQLRRGIALWKVGQRSFLVQHRLSATERRIVDTDAAMTAR